MEDVLSGLPPHERRRLEAVPGGDVTDLARRRAEGEPLQYLEGTAPFADFDVVVDERVLIPRPETEGLYELAASLAGEPELIVDLGTGSGVLAIALARRFPDAEVHAVDISPAALDVARANSRRLGTGMHFHEGDLFGPLPDRLRRRVDLLVANPPYVAADEWATLPPDVRREPRRALVAGEAGTEVLERIAAGAGEWLSPGGAVICEMGETQTEAMERAFSVVGVVTVHSDLAGRPRYVVARAPT
ncbi:MAG: peptide chain release factor N(5)-glutamine methyltransferase [bacterium]